MPQEGRFYGSYREKPSVEEVIAWLNRRNWAMQRHIFVAIQALKKQVPMKPTDYAPDFENDSYSGGCPVCDSVVFGKFCSECGQALDWGDV